MTNYREARKHVNFLKTKYEKIIRKKNVKDVMR